MDIAVRLVDGSEDIFQDDVSSETDEGRRVLKEIRHFKIHRYVVADDEHLEIWCGYLEQSRDVKRFNKDGSDASWQPSGNWGQKTEWCPEMRTAFYRAHQWTSVREV